MTNEKSERIQTFREFWPYYLGEHRDPSTRKLHFIGTTSALVIVIAMVATQIWWLLAVALVAGYGPAWIAHFGVEHNRPATFRYPIWSLRADFKLWFRMLTGRPLNDSSLPPSA